MSRRLGFGSAVVLFALLLVGCPETTEVPDAGNAPDAGDVDAGPLAGPPAWRWENPTPSGWGVLALWGFAADDVWAAGFYGNLLHWDGRAWAEAYVGNTGDYQGIWGFSPTDVWVAGEDRANLLHFDGTTWTPVPHPEELPLQALWGFGADDIWAVGGRYFSGVTTGTILHFDGTAWTKVNNDLATTWRAVWGSGPTDLFVGGDGGALMTFDGTTWTPILGISGQVRAIRGFDATGDVFVLTENALLRHVRGRPGVTEVKAFDQPRALWGTAADDLFVADKAGMTHFDGTTWAPILTLPGTDQSLLRALWGTGETLFAGGDGPGGWDSAGLWRRAGTTWTNDARFLTGAEFRDVFAVSSTLAYAAGDNGTLAAWDGTSWSLVPVDTTQSLRGLWASDAALVVTGDDGILRVRSAAGWATFTSEGNGRLGQVRGKAIDDLYVVGGDYNNPKLHHFDGAALTPVDLPDNLAVLNSLWIDPASGTPFLAARRLDNTTGVLRRESNGSWTTLSSTLVTSVTSLSGTSPTNLYAVEQSNVFHWDGTTWTLAFECPETSYFTRIWARTADDIWAVGYDSVIVHFDGSAWSIVQQRSSGWELFAVHGSGADDVIVVGESGHLLRFTPTLPAD